MKSWKATENIPFIDGLGGEIVRGEVFACDDHDFNSYDKEHTVSVGKAPNQRFRKIGVYHFLTRALPSDDSAIEAVAEEERMPNRQVMMAWVLMMEKFFGSVKSIHNNGRSLNVLCDYSARDWNALRSLNKSLGVELASIESTIPEVRQLGEGEKDEGKNRGLENPNGDPDDCSFCGGVVQWWERQRKNRWVVKCLSCEQMELREPKNHGSEKD